MHPERAKQRRSDPKTVKQWNFEPEPGEFGEFLWEAIKNLVSNWVKGNLGWGRKQPGFKSCKWKGAKEIRSTYRHKINGKWNKIFQQKPFKCRKWDFWKQKSIERDQWLIRESKSIQCCQLLCQRATCRKRVKCQLCCPERPTSTSPFGSTGWSWKLGRIILFGSNFPRPKIKKSEVVENSFLCSGYCWVELGSGSTKLGEPRFAESLGWSKGQISTSQAPRLTI